MSGARVCEGFLQVFGKSFDAIVMFFRKSLENFLSEWALWGANLLKCLAPWARASLPGCFLLRCFPPGMFFYLGGEKIKITK